MADAPNLETSAGSQGSTGAPDDARLHEIKVNGVVEHLTLDELKTRAQKVSAADKYLQDASKTAKEHEVAIKGWNALLKAKSGDRDALKEGFRELGVPDATTEEYLATMEAELKSAGSHQSTGSGGSGDRSHPGGGGGNGLPEPLLKTVTEFFKVAQEAGVDPAQMMRTMAAQHKKTGDEVFRSGLAEQLKKDPVVGSVMREKGKANSLVNLTRDVVIRRMAMENRPLTDDLVQAAIQEIRGTAKNLGLGAADNLDPVVLGAAPSSGIGSASHRNPQKRPSATDDQAHAAWVSSRMRDIMRETEGEPVSDGFFGG